ncbi:mitochondrial ribosomal small subunit component [Saxophila tyrrhenica]|uniref:Small ribosomal subunit protein mS23 n=1 Tax=Saxophila tyrrhenica TaxID=1690608 RepID=A0AAV9PGE8_9PEZI|nr:mitochondrial ribosomal small subunit component [Saxophila tyrrhenica]
MGRLNHAASRVHTQATQILNNTRHTYPPPWLATIQTTPPSSKLTRPVLKRAQKPGKRSSRIFTPVNLTYQEDKLRWEYFNDHPWELARPRVVLENDGRDRERWDWGIELDVSLNRPRRKTRDKRGRTEDDWEIIMDTQAARPLNGEAVIQRQQWLLTHTPLSSAAAYDQARKELYRVRHFQETEQRVAREEAQSVGAFFGLGPLEIGMQLEDKAYEDWKEWAIRETAALKQIQGSAYTGVGTEEAEDEMTPELGEGSAEELEVVKESIPSTQRGQRARGDAAIHP